ncbi:MAG: hypothetical protein HY647_09395 [Acidobacteria bacterium]|nr:hypothetical protein [Acidobacteriota bacterium]
MKHPSQRLHRLAAYGSALACWLLFRAGLPVQAQGSADAAERITFVKEFPNSQPEYFAVAVESNGTTVYRTAPDDEAALQFQLAAPLAEQIFSLARKLNRFRETPLESKRPVARMGTKTLIYDNSAEHYEVRFNHTEVREALELVEIFERISQTQQHAFRLQHLLRFDRLGIVKELLNLEMSLDQGRLAEPALLLPLLEKIRKDRSLVNVAQSRAAQVIAKIQSGK